MSGPLIFNILPTPGTNNVRITDPIRLSMRDQDTFIDPTSINVIVGYAKSFAAGTAPFNLLIPRTRVLSALSEPVNSDASIVVAPGGVKIVKTASDPQRSTYFSSVDGGSNIISAMAMALLQPQVEDALASSGAPLNLACMPGVHPLPYAVGASGTTSFGAVLGLEIGVRNTAAYAFFVNLGTLTSPSYAIRLTGPDVAGVRNPDVTIGYDWSQFNTYYLVWNEGIGFCQLFGDLNGQTTLILSISITDFNLFTTQNIVTPRRGGLTDITGIYGEEGTAGDTVTIGAVAVSADVSFPFIGGARPGDFVTLRKSAEVIGFANADPRTLVMSPWFDTPATIFAHEDPNAFKAVVGKAFRISKDQASETATVYRQEPGFARALTDGFLLEATIFADTATLDVASSNMGILINDGTTVFQLDLLNDLVTHNIGLFLRGGSVTTTVGHVLPSTPIDWSSPVSFRFTVDTHRNLIEIFLLPDIDTPILSHGLDRSQLPTAASYGWATQVPFIAFGGIVAGAAVANLDTYSLNFSHLYQAFESRDTDVPDAASPAYTKQGSGTASFVSGGLQLSTTPGQQLYYFREGILDPFRGSIVEARLAIPSFKPRSTTGVFIVLDDGDIAYMLSFVDTNSGRYACLSLTAGLDDVGDLVGRDGVRAKVSFPIDWTQSHIYRMERRPNDGLYIFVDQSTTPSLVVPDGQTFVTLAQTRQNPAFPLQPFFFPVPPSPPTNGTVGFGHFRDYGAVSVWGFVRHTFSLGFELSATKNAPENFLVEEIAGTQALIVAYAKDEDI